MSHAVGRRDYGDRSKRSAASWNQLRPRTSVARVARRHAVNANQVFYWRKQYREGRLDEGHGCPTAWDVGTPKWDTSEDAASRISVVTEAEKLFNETYARWLYTYSVILGFRNSFTEVSANVANRLQESLYRCFAI